MINGLENIYEWHESPGSNEGSVSLLSGGASEQPVEDAVISPSGQDVFFVTTAGLVPQDTDGLSDIYDARIERPNGDSGSRRLPAKRAPATRVKAR